jgi:hypothetical protein
VVFVFLACFHAFFYMIDSGINGLDGRYAMSALVMLGFFQMMLGLLQGFKRSLHVRLIVIIVACESSNGNAKESKTSLAKPELSIKHESKRTTPLDIAADMPKYALAIPHKAIACLYLGGFSADNHARILPHDSQLR